MKSAQGVIMRDISTVLVAGSGAIGSMVASLIDDALPGSISILAGGERLARYREKGFIINGKQRFFPLVDVDSASKKDLIIIACKAHHLDQVLKDLSSHIGDGTLILSLLNGISSEEIAGKVYGKARLPFAMIVGTDAGRTDNVVTFTSTGTIFFGDALNSRDKNKWSPRVAPIAAFFDRAGIKYTVPENMLNRLWYKFMLNVATNQITAILRRPYRIIKKGTMTNETKELMDETMREVIAVAKAEGIILTGADMAEVYSTMDKLVDEGKTSMCQDVEAGRKTEVELFSGTMIALGKKWGIPVPVNALLYRMLKTIEASY